MTDHPPSRKNNPTPTKNDSGGGTSGTVGSIIGIIIIVFVFALGGLYLWGKRATVNKTAPDLELSNANNAN